MAKQIFVNMPVKDLKRSVDFFTKVGYTFNPTFTDDNATCMIISEDIYVMLLVEKFFKTFITKDVCDSSKEIESIVCLSCDTREEVDTIVDSALAAGAASTPPSEEPDFMYSRSFYDLDGHAWNYVYMDMSKFPRA